MFYALLGFTLVISLGVSAVVAGLFSSPARSILRGLINTEAATAWTRYLRFMLFIIGIKSGIQMWLLERYVIAPGGGPHVRHEDLTVAKWVLEAYRTAVGTLQGQAAVLTGFFLISLIAMLVIRVAEAFRKNRDSTPA